MLRKGFAPVWDTETGLHVAAKSLTIGLAIVSEMGGDRKANAEMGTSGREGPS